MENKTNSWIIVLTVVVMAVVIGGGVYYWQGQNPTEVAPIEEVVVVPETKEVPDNAKQSVIENKNSAKTPIDLKSPTQSSDGTVSDHKTLFSFDTSWYIVTLKADSKKWAVCNNPLSLHAYPREYYPTGCIPQGELMSAVPFDYFFFDPDFSPGMPPLADIVEETGPISFITDNNKTLSLKSMTVLNHQAGMTDSPYITSVYISDDSSDTNFYFTFITAQKFSEYNKTDLYSILKTMDWR